MILLTGAGGIVGRAVGKAMDSVRIPYLPVVQERRAFSPENTLALDLSRDESVRFLSRYPIDAVVHLAAAVPHSANYPDTIATARITRSIDQTVFTLQEQLGIPVIYMSTCGLYNRNIGKEKQEDDASLIRVESPYFEAKLDGELLFGGSDCSSVLRLSAPVGPGLKPSVVFSKFVKAALSNSPIQIWGSGKREQNFIDVRDVADLVLKVLARPRPCTLNVASKAPTTMTDLAKTIIAVVGKGAIEYSGHVDPRDGETAQYCISKAFSLYGWSPKYDLAASCRFVVDAEFEDKT